MKCNVKGFVAQSSWPCILYLLDCFSENIWQYVITLHFHSKLLNLVSPRTSIKYDLSLSHIAQIENLLLLGVRSLGFRVFQQATICHQIVKTENGMMFEFIWSKVGWESSRSWCHFIYIYMAIMLSIGLVFEVWFPNWVEHFWKVCHQVVPRRL
jgi:hypothetical protein